MILDSYQIVNRPLLTEKYDVQRETQNAYAFEVDRRANKIQIRDAIEALFDVKVTGVRTQVMRGKPKRMGRFFGRRPSWKKAVVTLRKGDEIDLIEGGTPA
mgnify:FL=1